MKLIGKVSVPTEEEGTKIFEAIITENKETFDIELYEVFSDGTKGENLLLGQWASSLGSAKRRINQSTGIKSNYWKWKEI